MWLSLDSAITSRKLRTRSGNTPRGWWSTRTPGAGESCSRTLRYACTELEAPYNIVHNHVNFVNWHLRKRGRFCVFAVVKKKQKQNNNPKTTVIMNLSCRIWNIDHKLNAILILLSVSQKPDRDEWGTGLDAMQVALQLEKTVNQSLLDLHKVADGHGDAQVK